MVLWEQKTKNPYLEVVNNFLLLRPYLQVRNLMIHQKNYKINIDLEDVRTVLSNSGNAIMGYAKANGEDRAEKAIKDAINSPLMDNNDIKGAKKVLLLIHEGNKPVKGIN